jgi:hypothetical protein
MVAEVKFLSYGLIPDDMQVFVSRLENREWRDDFTENEKGILLDASEGAPKFALVLRKEYEKMEYLLILFHRNIKHVAVVGKAIASDLGFIAAGEFGIKDISFVSVGCEYGIGYSLRSEYESIAEKILKQVQWQLFQDGLFLDFIPQQQACS